MTDKRTQQQAADSNMEKDPDDWVTGDEPMTGAQKSYLKTLSEEAKEPFDDTLTKAEASRRIDELQARTGRGAHGGGAHSGGSAATGGGSQSVGGSSTGGTGQGRDRVTDAPSRSERDTAEAGGDAAPDAPPDESPMESFGRAVGDTVLGAEPKQPTPRTPRDK